MIARLHTTSATARYYTEPLEGLSEAITLQMIQIPTGTFFRGEPENNTRPKASETAPERPLRETNVTSFFMSRYPVTPGSVESRRSAIAYPSAT